MDFRTRNLASRRVFGKDITNIDRRSKNASIAEKPATIPEVRMKSRSLASRNGEIHEALNDYETDIITFMTGMQRKELKEVFVGITEDMRGVLIDWLVDVHISFNLKEQTLHLTLHYLNTFCAIQEVTKQEYQLVGIACLWLASKFEEIYPPRMANYVQVTDCSYTIQELKSMEARIVLALQFNLTPVTSLQLLDAAADKWPKDNDGKPTRESMKTLFLTKYVLQLSLFQGLAREYCLKTLVLGCLRLSDHILRVKSEVGSLEGDKRDHDTVMRCFKDVCVVLQNASKAQVKTKAIRRKYLDQKRMAVAKYRIQFKSNNEK